MSFYIVFFFFQHSNRLAFDYSYSFQYNILQCLLNCNKFSDIFHFRSGKNVLLISFWFWFWFDGTGTAIIIIEITSYFINVICALPINGCASRDEPNKKKKINKFKIEMFFLAFLKNSHLTYSIEIEMPFSFVISYFI